MDEAIHATEPVALSAGSVRSRSLDVGPFRLVDAWFPQGDLGPHLHDRGAVVVVLDGSMELGFGRRSYDCHPGTVASEPVDAPHANRFGRDGVRVLALQPDHEDTTGYEPCADLLDSAHARRDAGLRTLGWRVAHELRATDAAAPVAAHGLGLELIAAAARLRAPRGPAPPAWLEVVDQLLHDRFLDRVDLPTVAAAVGVHPVHVARVHRRFRGESVGATVRRLRLDWAVHQVTTGDLPLVEIARRAGYADQSHFTRAFKQHVGLPPGRYRRELRR